MASCLIYELIDVILMLSITEVKLSKYNYHLKPNVI